MTVFIAYIVLELSSGIGRKIMGNLKSKPIQNRLDLGPGWQRLKYCFRARFVVKIAHKDIDAKKILQFVAHGAMEGLGYWQ